MTLECINQCSHRSAVVSSEQHMIPITVPLSASYAAETPTTPPCGDTQAHIKHGHHLPPHPDQVEACEAESCP